MFACTVIITGAGTWAMYGINLKFQGTSAEPTKKRSRPSTKKSRGTILYVIHV